MLHRLMYLRIVSASAGLQPVSVRSCVLCRLFLGLEVSVWVVSFWFSEVLGCSANWLDGLCTGLDGLCTVFSSNVVPRLLARCVLLFNLLCLSSVVPTAALPLSRLTTAACVGNKCVARCLIAVEYG